MEAVNVVMPQLEQNKAKANIREEKQNKVAQSPVSIALYGAGKRQTLRAYRLQSLHFQVITLRKESQQMTRTQRRERTYTECINRIY